MVEGVMAGAPPGRTPRAWNTGPTHVESASFRAFWAHVGHLRNPDPMGFRPTTVAFYAANTPEIGPVVAKNAHYCRLLATIDHQWASYGIRTHDPRLLIRGRFSTADRPF